MSETKNESVNFENDPAFRPIEVPPLSQTTTKSKYGKKRRLQKSYRKKVEREWSQDQILKLVQEIEARRALWDAGCTEYKMPKEHLWQEVADSVNTSLNDCKGKWSNLRITFKSNLEKYRKKTSDQDSSEPIAITWKYFKPMLFLEGNKVLQCTRPSSMELNSAIDDKSLLNASERNTLDCVSPSPLTSGHERRTSTPSPSPSDDSRFMQIPIESLRSIRSQPQNASAALCDYIASELQILTPEQAALARSKLRRAFSDIIDEVLLIPSSRNEQPRQRPLEQYKLMSFTGSQQRKAKSNRNNRQ